MFLKPFVFRMISLILLFVASILALLMPSRMVFNIWLLWRLIFLYSSLKAGIAEKDIVLRNMKKHDPESPFLIGNALPGDVVKQSKQKSWIDPQMRFVF
jgi:hypothetical protein